MESNKMLTEELIVSFILGKLTSDGVITNDVAKETRIRYEAEKGKQMEKTA